MARRRHLVSLTLTARSRGARGVGGNPACPQQQGQRRGCSALSFPSELRHGKQIATQGPSQRAELESPSSRLPTSFKLPNTTLTPCSRFFFNYSEERGNQLLISSPEFGIPMAFFCPPPLLTTAPFTLRTEPDWGVSIIFFSRHWWSLAGRTDGSHQHGPFTTSTFTSTSASASTNSTSVTATLREAREASHGADEV